MTALIAASGFCLLAAISLYLASPNQQLSRKPWPGKPMMVLGFAASILALACLMQEMGKPAAVFMLMTVLMVLWSFIPLLIAYLGRNNEQAKPRSKRG